MVTEWTVPSISILEAERVHHKESAKKLVEEYKSLPPDDVDAVGDLQSRWEEWMESCVEVSSCMFAVISYPDKCVIIARQAM